MKGKIFLTWLLSCLCVVTFGAAACGETGEDSSVSNSSSSSASNSSSVSGGGAISSGSSSDDGSIVDSSISSVESSREDDETSSSVSVEDSSSEENAEKGASVGLEYTLSKDGKEYSVTGIGNCADTDVVIPSTYNGLPVTSVGDYAFYDCKHLTSVKIAKGVKDIGAHAFQFCFGLTSVEIPDGVTSIGENAFGLCDTLTSITIPDSVTHIGDYAFDACNNATSVKIGNGVTSIGIYAFDDCKKIASVEIPESVTSIGYKAFYRCDSLTSVTFKNTDNWYIVDDVSDWENKTGGESISVADGATNAANFKLDYALYYWYRTIDAPDEDVSSPDESASEEESSHTHNYTQQVAIDMYLNSAATCTKKATYYYSCECGEAGAATFAFGELAPHTEVVDAAVAATTTEDGLTEGKHCSVCQTVLVKQEIVYASGSVGLAYDGNTVVGIGECADKDILIPRYSPSGDL